MTWNDALGALSIFPLGDIIVTLLLIPVWLLFLVKGVRSDSVRKRAGYLTLVVAVSFGIAASLQQVLLYT